MTFADLHHGSTPLLLPNAWDVPSALAFLAAGYAAIGTTSFGVASGLGRADGGRATREANLRLATALRRLPAHLSMDIEDGYSDEPGEVADYVAGLGVAGVNIEDSTDERLISPDASAAKITAIKSRCPELFVNARVDTYWLGQDATVEATVRRAAGYVRAGADGIFVPGTSDPDEVRALAGAIDAPLNVLAAPGMSLDAWGELGVRRVSTGSLPYRAALRAAVDVAESVRSGRSGPAALAYSELQARLVRFEQSSGEP